MANFRLNTDKTEKGALADNDLFLIEDSDASFGVKYAKRGTVKNEIVAAAETEILAETDTRYPAIADFNDLVSLVNTYNFTDVINTVHHGKTSAGAPAFLSYSTLNVSIDTNGGLDKLRLNSATGRGDQGRQATVININNDVSNAWTVPSTAGTYQLCIKSDGSYYVSTKDLYYYSGTIAPSAPATGQLFFNIPKNIMQRYNGTSWVDDAMTVCAECVTNGTIITSLVHYAYNGIAMITATPITLGSSFVLQHNLGCNYDAMQCNSFVYSTTGGAGTYDLLPRPIEFFVDNLFYGTTIESISRLSIRYGVGATAFWGGHRANDVLTGTGSINLTIKRNY